MVPHILEHIAFVRGHQPHHLGHVQGGTTTEADHAVGAMGLEGGRAGHDLGAGRVANHAIENSHLQPGQVGLELGHHGQCGQRAVGDDERAFATLFKQVRCHAHARAGAKVDGGGEGKA